MKKAKPRAYYITETMSAKEREKMWRYLVDKYGRSVSLYEFLYNIDALKIVKTP